MLNSLPQKMLDNNEAMKAIIERMVSNHPNAVKERITTMITCFARSTQVAIENSRR